jgi:hypothetical protein
MERENVECQTSNVATLAAGTQVHDFNIIDAYDGTDAKQNAITPPAVVVGVSGDAENPHGAHVDRLETDYETEEPHSVQRMFLERILAQNALDVQLFWSNDMEKTSRSDELPGQQTSFELTYCFTLTLLGDADKGLAVRYMQWNETEKQLLAVVYSKLIYTDYTSRQYASVAVWNTKNHHTPER